MALQAYSRSRFLVKLERSNRNNLALLIAEIGNKLNVYLIFWSEKYRIRDQRQLFGWILMLKASLWTDSKTIVFLKNNIGEGDYIDFVASQLSKTYLEISFYGFFKPSQEALHAHCFHWVIFQFLEGKLEFNLSKLDKILILILLVKEVIIFWLKLLNFQSNCNTADILFSSELEIFSQILSKRTILHCSITFLRHLWRDSQSHEE